jgi:hypothetical protein
VDIASAWAAEHLDDGDAVLTGYVMAVRANHVVSTGSGRAVTAAAADPGHHPGATAAPARHRHPRPGETGPTGCAGRPGDAAASTAPAKPTGAGMLMQRQRYEHNELQLP